MATQDVNLSGAYTINNGTTGVWHELHNNNAGYAGIKVNGTLTFERTSTDSKTISVKGRVVNTLVGSSPVYGYSIDFAIISGSDIKTVNNSADRVNTYVNNASLQSSTQTIGIGTYSIAKSFDNDWENGSLYVCLRCGQTGGCSIGYSGSNSNPHSAWVVIGKLDVSKIPYKPYKKPTISISTNTDITIYNQNRNINIAGNTSGDTHSTTVKVTVNGKEHTTSIGNNSNVFTFKPSDNNVSDGVSYNVKARRTHDSDKNLYADSNTLTLYTYRTPKIQNLQLDNINFSGWGNVKCSWETSTRKWDLNPTERDFKTYIQLKGTWKESINSNPKGTSDQNTLSPQSQLIEEDFIDSILTIDDRCQPKISTSISLRRENPSSGVVADIGPKNITIQYQPKYEPSIMEYYSYNETKGKKLSEGQTVYLDESPNILVQWLLPSNFDRGVVDGFELYVYTDNTYNDKKSEHDITTTSHSQVSGEKILDTRKDLVRGQINYIGVRAYYINPKGEKMYGPELQQRFVLPIGRLKKPIISYPITDTQWHNNQFRILFELPEDDDYDVLNEQIENDTYTYKEIELTINNTIYTYTSNPNIFSVNKLGYKYRVCINPSLITEFPNITSYNMKIRIQKNYFVNIWSEYSDIINLNIIPVKRQNLIKGEKILADEYKYVQSASSRLHAVYPIQDIPKGNVNRNTGDIIWAKDYKAIYDTILQIQSDVNTWARYDNKDNVKFNESILELSGSNNPKQEIITAKDDERPLLQGRNYMNILVDCMNKLK